MLAQQNDEAPSSPLVWLTRLSLDAPLVAVLWQRLFASSLRVPLDAAVTAVLAMAVWLLYVLDRILDAWRGDGAAVAPRHVFYRQHWGLFLLPLFVVAALAALLSFTELQRSVVEVGLVLLLAIGAYFYFVHFHLASDTLRAPKELCVGLLFAVGTGFPVWIRLDRGGEEMLAPWIIFALLCWLNCSAIEFAEWQPSGGFRPVEDEFYRSPRKGSPHASTRWMGRHAIAVALGAALVSFALAVVAFPRAVWPLYAAEALAALATALVEATANQMPQDLFRVLMDVALLTPAFFLPFARA